MVGGGKDREEMSELISRSELLKKLESNKLQPTKDTDGFIDGWCEGFNTVVDMIRNQPTAFDTEKVVEEVKKLDLDGVSMVEDGKYTLVRRNEVISLIQTNGVCNGRQKSCKYCYKKDCLLSTEKTLSDKWSDIVKKGGVE